MPDDVQFATSAQVKSAVAEQLANAPLYSILSYLDASSTSELPETITLFCDGCEKETNWGLVYSQYASGNHRNGFSEKQYKCRNCTGRSVKYYYYWAEQDGRVMFFKVGQWPQLEERIPAELRKNLDRTNLNLYYKALRCRSQGLGLGSLVYLRRVVEEKINTILDLIAEESEQVGFAAEQLARVAEVRDKGLFRDKIALASVILPPSLRPGGHNPIDALHDLASDGIHRLSDEESIAVFDRVRFVFEYLFREIDMRRRSANEYALSVAKIASSKKGTQNA